MTNSYKKETNNMYSNRYKFFKNFIKIKDETQTGNA